MNTVRERFVIAGIFIGAALICMVLFGPSKYAWPCIGTALIVVVVVAILMLSGDSSQSKEG